MYLKSRTRGARRRGATLALTLICLTGIVLLSALAIDCGNMMAQRRQAQNCADAAALAGCIKVANLYAQGTTPDATTVGTAVTTSASGNGYSSGVTPHYPPTSGGHQNSYSVEADIQFTYNNLIIGGSTPVTVRAVATCNPGNAPYVPMLLTEPSAAKSFWVNSGKLTLNNSSIMVNSSSSTAAVVDGLSTSACDASVRTAGGTSGSFSPAAKAGFGPTANPYSLLPVPSTSGMTTYTTSSYSPNLSGTITLNPGYYPNGLYCINGGNVTMNAGTYVIKGGNFWINTTGTVTANGVTVVHDGGLTTSALAYQDFSITGGIILCPTNSNYTFTPPTSGTYAGISFFQTSNCTAPAMYDFWGTGTLNTGIQYFPKSTLRCWSKSGGTINCNQLVALDFKVSGAHEYYGTSQNNGFSTVTWNASKASNAPPTAVVLVE